MSTKVEFAPPKGFLLPEGVVAGESFDSVCTFQIGEAGKLCLTQLGETRMPGYDGKEIKPDYQAYVKPMQTGEAEQTNESEY